MKVSIITINLDNLCGLKKTVLSVLEQQYHDYEYIIIDGASSDGSVEWITQISSKNPSLTWISERDAGVFNAMNKGIRIAKGEYLLFLNSGDYLVDSNVLNNVFSKDRTSDILIGQLLVSSNGQIIGHLLPQPHYSLAYFVHGSIAHQASFIKRDLFLRFGLYREDLKFMGDWAFFLQAIVLNDCSISTLGFDISNYNTEGISSNKKNLQSMQDERNTIYSDLKLENIVPDYINWDNWKKEHEVIEWAWRKGLIRKPIELLFGLAKKMHHVVK